MRSHPDCLDRLQTAGISWEDSCALRRIAMSLHRWHELECGDGNDYASWCIARGRKENGEFVYDDAGKPFLERHAHSENKARYSSMPDRERGAIKRLRKIMARYPEFWSYVQTDPRGASLYVGQYTPATKGADPALFYNSGIAVHK